MRLGAKCLVAETSRGEQTKGRNVICLKSKIHEIHEIQLL